MHHRHSSTFRSLNYHARTLLFGIVALAATAIWPVHAQINTSPTMAGAQPTLLVLGDSISAGYGIQREQGWVNLLQQHLATRESGWQVVNASVSGETTSGGLARLPALLDTHQPDLLVIELGGNDGLRGYPTTKMQANLTAMVQMARGDGIDVALMAMRIPPNYGPRYTRDFEQAFVTVANNEDTLLVPFFLESVALEDGMMQADGIHPTAAAQPLMRDFALEYLAPLMGALNP